MLHRYFPHTEEDISVMLQKCGLSDMKDLYSDVPEQLLLGCDYDLPDEWSRKWLL